MGNINNLIIFNEARELVRLTSALTAEIKFGRKYREGKQDAQKNGDSQGRLHQFSSS